jgi:hypothetical protein
LRALDSHIAKGEHRLFAHGELMEKLKYGSNLTLAHWTRSQRVSYITRVGDLYCGVGYYKQ